MGNQHCAILHSRGGKLYLRPINGLVTLFSISVFQYLLRDEREKKPRIYVNTNGTDEYRLYGGVDRMRQLTKEFCCFTIGDSSTIYWLHYPKLVLGDDEHEFGIAPDVYRERERREKERERDGAQRERDRNANGDINGSVRGVSGRDNYATSRSDTNRAGSYRTGGSGRDDRERYEHYVGGR